MNRSSQTPISHIAEKIQAIRTANSLKRLLGEYTSDQVYEYTDYFSRPVYEELMRIKGTVFWVLDDYFLYDFKQKQIRQILKEDLGFSEQNEEILEDFEKYLQRNIEYLKEITISDMMNYKIEWGENDHIKE